MPVPSPRVIRNPDIHPLVHSVYCRPQYFGQLMLDGGMTPDQIRDVSIVFSGSEGLEYSYDGAITRGHYAHEDRRVTVNLGYFPDADALREQVRGISPAERRDYANFIAASRNERITETTSHEVKHVIDWHVLSDAERAQEHQAHFHKMFSRRNARSEWMGLVMGMSLVGVLAEMTFIQQPDVLIDSLFGTMGAGLVAGIAGIRLAQKATNTHRSHTDYLARPWEVRAREYGRAQVAALKRANRPMPVRADFKAVRSLGSFA